jgi:hypothetical protein
MQRLTVLASQDPAYELLRTISGIGPIIMPALLASLGHAQQFNESAARFLLRNTLTTPIPLWFHRLRN